MDSVIRKKFCLHPIFFFQREVSFIMLRQKKKRKNSRKTVKAMISRFKNSVQIVVPRFSLTIRATSCKKENMDNISRNIGDHNRSHVAISRARYFQDSLPEKMYLFPRVGSFFSTSDGVSPGQLVACSLSRDQAYPSAFEKESVEGGSIEIGGL